MGMLVMAGKWANALERATITASPSANALYPVTNLVSGNPARECVLSSTAASSLTVDMDIIGTPGGFEGAALEAPYSNASTGSGTAVTGAGAPRTGSKSAVVNSGAAGTGIMVAALSLKTGHRYRYECWARNTAGVAGSIQSIIVFNPETGRYLQALGGAWGASPVSLVTRQSATYGLLSVDFTVESFAATQKDTCTVWIQHQTSTNVNEATYFDDSRIWSEIDTVAIFGHNVGALNAVQVRSSTDNFAASDTLEATFTVPLVRPAAYKKLTASITRRYIRLVLAAAGNPDGGVRIGELWAGQAYTATRAVSAVVGNPEVSIVRRQIVSDFQTFPLSDYPETSLVLPMHLLNSTDHKAFRDEIVERSKGSLYPLVVVPDDVLEPALVVMGKLPGEQSYRRIPVDQRETLLLIDGLPYATVVA